MKNPTRIEAVLERRSSNAAGPHQTRRHQPKGGRQGGRRQAIAEQARR